MSIYLKVETFLHLCEWTDSNIHHGQAVQQVVQQFLHLGGDQLVMHAGISETYFLNRNLKEVHNHQHNSSLVKTNTKCLAVGEYKLP